MSQKDILPHLSNGISLPNKHALSKDNISQLGMASYILVPRAHVSVVHVVSETDIFFNDVLRQVAMRTTMGKLSKADTKTTAQEHCSIVDR